MKPETAETEGRRLTEGERVVLYRAEELERAGYSRLAASAIAARRDVDLHLALWLPRNGCPHGTAVRILL
jgi:hypothetical protein